MALLDPLLSPLDAVSPFLSLGAAALATAALAVAVQRVATRPSSIERARHRMFGELLGAVVYRHDPVLVVRAMARFGAGLGGYLGRSLAPLLILALPLGALFLQLDARYGYEPLAPGETTLVRVGPVDAGRPVLEPSPGIRALTPAVRLPDAGYAWRIEVEAPGVHTVRAGSRAIPIVARPGVSVDPDAVEYRPRVLRLGRVREPWYVFYLADVLVLAWAIAATFGVRF